MRGRMMMLMVATAVALGACEGPEGDEQADAADAVADTTKADAVADTTKADTAQADSAPEADGAPATTPDVVASDVAAPVPELQVAPQALDFGDVAVGAHATLSLMLANVGTGTLSVTALELTGDSGFSVELAPSSGAAAEAPALPLSLAPGESQEVLVHFDASAAAGATGGLTVRSDDPAHPDGLPVPLHAVGTGAGDSVPAQAGGDALQVVPQTRLQLTPPEPAAGAPAPARFEWTVVQPVGSASVFRPSSTSPTPTFEVNVAGQYEFELQAYDQDDAPAFAPMAVTVNVVPGAAVHVELLWDTPADPDATDEGPESGADLDLHFAHPSASSGGGDGWFDAPFDCYWFNPFPNWGSTTPGVDDDPALDRDDTDGAGPENLNLELPEDGSVYTIGVNYWSDHGFGCSNATVRIYLDGVLAWEQADVPLGAHDFWQVATLAWPSGEIQPLTGPDGGPSILPGYPTPFLPDPIAGSPLSSCP
ncbi:MAG: choice-of-anchor D domain-containing protein [Deltaproteobacteria bacterium]|nr:choice-of-anchor D domain-containing protein [Deltaproteobacteria bacterium]